MMERQFRILWGPTLETVLDFSYPVVGDAPLLWRGLRVGSERVDGATTADVSLTGRDYFLSVTAKWFDLTRAAGATGLQAFIDWANAGNSFTLVPDPISLPTLTVPGCFLEEPFLAPSWSVETGGEMTVNLVIRHPTIDLGLAWRGLFFEYVAGQSLTDPVAYTFSRASASDEINNKGYLTENPSGTLCDGHYPSPLGSGFQTTSLQAAATNKLTAPEDLSNAAWTITAGVTVPSINNPSPRNSDLTASFLREDVSNGQHHRGQGYTLAVAGNPTGSTFFLKANGRTKAQIILGNVGLTSWCGVNIDLGASTVTPNNAGTGTLTFSQIVPLANGWFMVQVYGKVDSGVATSVVWDLYLQNGAGASSYLGDGASGMYVWGCVATDNQVAGMYWGTGASRSADVLSTAWTRTPQSQWVYAKFVELGAAQTTGYPRIFGISDAANSTPQTMIFSEKSNGPAQYGFSFWNTSNGECNPTAPPNPGDIVEILGIIFPDGSTQQRVSINGGAEVVSSNPTTQAFPAAWSGPTLWLGGVNGATGDTGLVSFKIGPLTPTGQAAVTTIAAARTK